MTTNEATPSRVSTVELHRHDEHKPKVWLEVRPWAAGGRRDPNIPEVDVGVLDVADDGTLIDPAQLDDILVAIDDARACAPSDGQPIVVVFVHGWHHNSDWWRSAKPQLDAADGDEHFAAFRESLRHLQLREEERPSSVGAVSRRVIGVYVGWRGDWRLWGTNRRLYTFLSFWGRYRAARGIGGSLHLARALRGIIESIKTQRPASSGAQAAPGGHIGQLVVIGHSMGALIVEKALDALLPAGPPLEPSAGPAPLFPDLLLALNSAADSRILASIRDRLTDLGKSTPGGAVSYSPPMLISATSVCDHATKWLWRLSQGVHMFQRRTDGHDPGLRTHMLLAGPETTGCRRLDQELDHGQTFHCLRPPAPPGVPTPDIPMDLPTCARASTDVDGAHRRYVLKALDRHTARLAWAIQIPADVIRSHNEVFGVTALSLILALIQISGATVGLAKDWERIFEPEPGPAPG